MLVYYKTYTKTNLNLYEWQKKTKYKLWAYTKENCTIFYDIYKICLFLFSFKNITCIQIIFEFVKIAFCLYSQSSTI